VPCAEQLRYTSSGSEATFFALRVARAFRKRDKILKFEGGFHGTHDYSLMSVGPRVPKAFPAPTADSAGIPHAISEEVLVAHSTTSPRRKRSSPRITRTWPPSSWNHSSGWWSRTRRFSRAFAR